jgi:phosphoglycolate phosphatase
MAYKAAIFDLDGTLVDSLADLADATNYALKIFGQPSRDIQAFRQMVGDGTRMLISRALEPDKQHLTKNVLEKMLEKYAQICLDKTWPYNGLPSVIAELAEREIKLAVLTNKDEKIAQKVVRHFFDSYFQIIKGTTAGIAVKPELFESLQVLEKFDVKPQESVFIGDSDVDMKTAKGCKMFAIGVSWGFRGRKELIEAGADVIVDEPGQIIDLFN